MIGNKYYKKDGGYKPEIAFWCNNNNATIVDNGDYYEVVKIESSIDNLKSSKKQEINQAREQARLDEGATYNDDLFDIDEKSQANITAIVSMLLANNVPEQFVSIYRSKTNVDHKLNKSQMIELGTTIGAKVSEIYKKSWDLKEQIDKATTKEEVEQITWS
jgi:hypothetical protein